MPEKKKKKTCSAIEPLGTSSTSQMYFLLPNQQSQNTEGIKQHQPQPVAWPHPLFVHHQTLDGRGVALFMLAL